MDQQNPMISLVCIDLWERLNSRIDFGNFNETEMENRIRSSLQIINGYLKDVVCVYVCTDERNIGETGEVHWLLLNCKKSIKWSNLTKWNNTNVI